MSTNLTKAIETAAHVIAEVVRQIEVEGYSPDHDDDHGPGGLVVIANGYALRALEARLRGADMRPDLVRATATLLAALEAAQRAEDRATAPIDGGPLVADPSPAPSLSGDRRRCDDGGTCHHHCGAYACKRTEHGYGRLDDGGGE